jgi:FG-GAP-like repeat/Abnormal spindle-like microcephaly-assoc'd, ASPM-SPD-2-Hydin/FG-GAP repeat
MVGPRKHLGRAPALVACVLAAIPLASAQFETRGSLVANQTPYSIAVADFNQDGILDLAVASAGSSTDTVTILLGNGDGTFRHEASYTVGVAPTSIVAADFNGDGVLDLAVANSLSDYVTILLGTGDGTFKAGPQAPSLTAPATRIAAGDFNGDGKPDLVTTGSNIISVMLGNGNGTFQNAVVTEPNFYVESFGIGDFNRDGKLDVVTAGDYTVNVFLGNGDGTFEYRASYPSGESPESIAVADFNGDHKLDLAIANSEGGTFSVLLGKGNGTFQEPVNYPIDFGVWIAAADFTGNGKLDLVVANDMVIGPGGYGGATVFAGNGDGTFQEPGTPYKAVSETSYVAVGDFNGDHKIDLAITDFGYDDVVVLLNTGVATFSPTTPLAFGKQEVGAKSAAQEVTLTNTGATALKISSMKASAQFGATSTCGASVAAGADCSISVTFSPKSQGAKTGKLMIEDSASSKPQVIQLSGTGT